MLSCLDGAPNVKLAGSEKILESGDRIVFDNRGFPIFDDVAEFETRITLTPGKADADMRAATRKLREEINSGRIDADGFSAEQLKAIQGGKERIPGLTWHHHQDRGRMQLIDRDIHGEVKHIGSVGLNKTPKKPKPIPPPKPKKDGK